ncbi:hypothetical protein HOLleu_32256 [Holothuria leucospilota]|uniref:Uncharacterized protein n=1 Tax=Holothuria leucospilota TaxID=206669 RepID=A0A9Q0YRC4_HOLLE|nr:hypothetical protein HOLleu_32256 [Holothuria leucospilota]
MVPQTLKATRDRSIEVTKRVTRSMSKSGSQLVKPLDFPQRLVNFSSSTASCTSGSGTLSGTLDRSSDSSIVPPNADFNTILRREQSRGGITTTFKLSTLPETSIGSLSDPGNGVIVTSSEPVVTQTNPSRAVARECGEQHVEPQSGYLHKLNVQVTLRDDDFFNVINLSKLQLSDYELRLLSKGLNFTPMPPCVDRLSLRESISTFERNLRLSEFFYSDEESDKAFDNSVAKFREKSTWSPPPNRDKFLDAYASVITNEIIYAPEQRAFSNLSVDERAARSDLKANCDIVIREADKGSAVVVMDRDLYIKEGYRQLDDPQVYERVSEAVLSDD